MFPLLSLVVSGVTLLTLVLLRERVEDMNNETKKKLEEIKANQLAQAESQAAISEAVDNVADDVKAQDAKITELKDALAAFELDASEQQLLNEVVAGSAALTTSSEELKAKAQAAAAIVADAPEVPTEG